VGGLIGLPGELFDWLAEGGWAGVGLLILAGYLVGALDQLRTAGLVVAGVWLVEGAGLALAGLWLVPMAVGWGEQQLLAIRLRTRFVESDVDTRPEADHYQWLAANLAVGLSPLALAAAAVADGTPLPVAAVVAVGIAICVAHLAYDRALSRLTRYVRWGLRRGEALGGTAAVLLGLGPFGQWLVETWTSHPAAQRAAPVLLPGIAVVAMHWTRHRGAALARRGMGAGGGMKVFIAVHRVLIGNGLFLFAATGVARPDGRLFAGTAGLVAVQCTSTVLIATRVRSPNWAFRRLEASLLMSTETGLFKDEMVMAWIHDAFYAPRRPDFSLLHTLITESVLAHRGVGQPLVGLLPGHESEVSARTGHAARRWIELADSLLRWIDNSVERWSRSGRWQADYERGRELVLAARTAALATLSSHLGEREEAVAHYLEAAELYGRHGLPNLAAQSEVGAAELDGVRLGRTDEALARLDAVATQEGLNPVVRLRALLVAALVLGRQGRWEDLTGLVGRAGTLRIGVRAWWRFRRENLAAHEPWSWRAELNVNRMLFQTVLALGAASESPQPSPTRPTAPPDRLTIPTAFWADSEAKRLVKQGVFAWSLRQYNMAEALLVEAAQRLESDDHPARAYLVYMVLGMGLRTVDPAGAYTHLREALRLQEDFRGLVSDPDVRMGASERITEIYVCTIVLLVDHAALRSEGWPGRPVEEAFRLAERVRSRVLLELLGEELQPDVGVEPISFPEVCTLLRSPT
jgi:tetratricopeptide (TPR) repeat protein